MRPLNPMETFCRWVAAVSRLCGAAAVALIFISLLVVCQMVFVRSVLGQSSIWQTEFVIFALIGSTFIGAPYVALTHGHVNMDLLPMMLGSRARLALALAASLFSLLFCLAVLWSSFDWWYASWKFGYRTSSMWRAPLWVPYAAVPIGMGALSLQYVADIMALATGRELPFGLPPKPPRA